MNATDEPIPSPSGPVTPWPSTAPRSPERTEKLAHILRVLSRNGATFAGGSGTPSFEEWNRWATGVVEQLVASGDREEKP